MSFCNSVTRAADNRCLRMKVLTTCPPCPEDGAHGDAALESQCVPGGRSCGVVRPLDGKSSLEE